MTRYISRGEVLGVPVDLVTECHADSDAITVTTSMLLPYFEWDLKRGVLNVWPPPLEPTPFGGSGTTAQVAVELGRAAILCELNEDYIQLIRQRTDTTPGLPL